MRLTAILLLAGLGAGARGFSQITLSEKNTPLRNVFKKIQQQSGYEFLYPADLVEKAGTVTVEVRDVTLEDALDATLAGKGLSFVISDKSVIIRQSAAPPGFPLDTGRVGAIRVRGVVLTEAGVPVQGANVTIKKTEHGTITNAKGEFELSSVPVGGVLVVSYVGYAPQDFTVKDGSLIRIYMKVAQDELDKAVVQAYGTTTQRLTTSDIGTLTAEEIERQPVMNPLLALEGKVAGLDVSQINGFASAPLKVELRGRSTIGNFPADPLYIVDGVPLTVLDISGAATYAGGSPGFIQSGLGTPAGGQSPFFSINPADIESIEVLKDADATAIYGSRGANGVILVTTKKGKSGKAKFDLNVQEGVTKVTRYWSMMNTQEYLTMRRQALTNDELTPSLAKGDFDLLSWDTTKYTNWQKVLYGGMGKKINAQGSWSGGNAQTTFRMAAGYDRTTGITTISGADQRANISFNLNQRSLDQRASLSLTSNYTFSESDLINLPGSITLAPDAPPIYDSAGNLNYEGYGAQNSRSRNAYLFSSLKEPYVGKTNFLNSSLQLSYLPVRGLRLSTSLGYSTAQSNTSNYFPIAAQDRLGNPTGTSYAGSTDNRNWIVEPQVSYDGVVARGKLSALLGASMQHTNTDALTVQAFGFSSDALIENIASATSTNTFNYSGEYRYAAAYGRLTYNWEDEYIVNFNARRDGSSRFGPGKQYGDFWSIGVAWIFTEESFFKRHLPFLTFGKMRGSYGTTGSDAVGDYAYLSRWTNDGGIPPYNGVSSIYPIQFDDPSFQWQVNRKLEAALDLGLFQNFVRVSAAYYRDRTGNQLVPFPTPAFSGFTSVTANSPALVQNAGLEATASARIVSSKNFEWSVSFNGAMNTNKLVSYPDISQSPYASTLIVGKPLNIVNLLHYTGVDPQTGVYTYEDKNHDGNITQSVPGDPLTDTYILNQSPKFFGGFGTNLNYKNLQISLFFNYKDQLGRSFRVLSSLPGTANHNQPEDILGHQWQKPGDIAQYGKFTTLSNVPFNLFKASDGAFSTASFVRLSNIVISYRLSASYLKRIGLQAFNIFLHTNNLFVITRYKGLDPETQNFGGMPPIRTIVGGLSLNF